MRVTEVGIKSMPDEHWTGHYQQVVISWFTKPIVKLGVIIE